MKTTQAELNARALLEQLERHPVTVAIRADEAARTLALRQDAGAKADALRKDRDETIPKLQAVLAAKEKVYLKAKAAVDAALAEWQTAKADLSGECHQFDTAIVGQEQILIDTADPLIDETIEYFKARLDALRKPGVIDRIGRADQTNVITWTKRTTQETNLNAVLSALKFCQAAIETLQQMKLEVQLDPAKIEELKAGIPHVDTFETFTGEKPMPEPITNPRFLEQSDSQLERDLAKVHEKFEQWKQGKLKK